MQKDFINASCRIYFHDGPIYLPCDHEHLLFCLSHLLYGHGHLHGHLFCLPFCPTFRHHVSHHEHLRDGRLTARNEVGIGGNLLEQVTLAGATRTKLDQVVVSLDEWHHSQKCHASGPFI